MRVDFDVVVTGEGYCQRDEASVWDGHSGVRRWVRGELEASEVHTKVTAYTKDYYILLYRGQPMRIFRVKKV